MTEIDIFSGFLGAGKTTLIKKLLSESYKNEKLVLIENEFGEIGIDGGFLKDSGVTINEMNSGCICCSLVGDFSRALEKVIKDYAPDRILIEPSGVGKLSDVKKAVETVLTYSVKIGSLVTVADVNRCKMYVKNFGEFYIDQIENSDMIVLSHTQNASERRVEECIRLLREHNAKAAIVTTPWDMITGDDIVKAMGRSLSLEEELEALKEQTGHHRGHHDHECCEHEHHHDHECCEHEQHHDHECCEHEHHHDHECCEHEQHHDHECCEHEHHHDHECCEHEHHHDNECCEHEHHHDHGENCTCGCHDHDHHHHHHADEVFESWGIESSARFGKEQIEGALKELENSEEYGLILRAKGIVASDSDKWIHFDYIPEESDIRYGAASLIGRICVIGSKINKEKIAKLFGAEL